ncbi:hypothetical protein KJS94_16495 [Flavihumibacter rivuli]|uniref:hypothetical protein n=1 Tax=Flavihumibacter rivuli TaxID=2838156 RepID=UPI001BDE9C21|nr:hypothetical protein [Flavihumibacter rivuli]ULQ56251.1 hypothetical protein KJS94_16495 [Flavihumibacter rivuli]
MNPGKLPISAIVVGKNDGDLLPNCLSRLGFCDELIYVDLGSTDGSVALAAGLGATVIHHEPVPIVEIVHAGLYQQTRHPAILVTDPDEVLDENLVAQMPRFLEKITNEKDNYAAIYAPMVNYFQGYRLRGTIWGGDYLGRIILVNRDRFVFAPYVHNGRLPKDGFNVLNIQFQGNNVVHHFWARSRKQLIEKHRRYIPKEGESQYNKGLRTNLVKVIQTPFFAFYECFIKHKGYKDSFQGLWLSCFWAWYKYNSQVQLLRYQRSA